MYQMVIVDIFLIEMVLAVVKIVISLLRILNQPRQHLQRWKGPQAQLNPVEEKIKKKKHNAVNIAMVMIDYYYYSRLFSCNWNSSAQILNLSTPSWVCLFSANLILFWASQSVMNEAWLSLTSSIYMWPSMPTSLSILLLTLPQSAINITLIIINITFMLIIYHSKSFAASEKISWSSIITCWSWWGHRQGQGQWYFKL